MELYTQSHPLSRRLHFINKFHSLNTGDHYGSVIDNIPLFLDYGLCIKHDIDKIIYKWIREGDAVIIGGGGLLNNNKVKWNAKIFVLIEHCKKNNIKLFCVGAGMHKYKNIKEISRPINFDDFVLSGIRDYNFIDTDGRKIEYLPCTTCMSPLFDKRYDVVREFGVVQQHKNRIVDIDVNNYESIRTIGHISQMLSFIGSCETLLTNSYHATLWAQLIGRRVILVNAWANKFDYMRHMPIRFSGNLTKDRERSELYLDFLRESRSIVNSFVQRILEHLE
ncbi:MAG: polysaccharide pyruvyl transferase family protein [Oscillospiraceae bacterium]|nr:polysaccharide pyruvyl transferase family protein [Oscillospiraceae bacterium]